jgi:hypothetical protein
MNPRPRRNKVVDLVRSGPAALLEAITQLTAAATRSELVG